MNSQHFSSQEQAADKFGRQIAARLSKSTDDLPHDITERLRAGRVQAVNKRKQILLETSADLFSRTHSGALTANHAGGHSSWWNKLGGAVLMLILAAGLLIINVIQDDMGARELADIDAAILTDDLPPAAYVDAGFAQFLKSSNRQEP